MVSVRMRHAPHPLEHGLLNLRRRRGCWRGVNRSLKLADQLLVAHIPRHHLLAHVAEHDAGTIQIPIEVIEVGQYHSDGGIGPAAHPGKCRLIRRFVVSMSASVQVSCGESGTPNGGLCCGLRRGVGDMGEDVGKLGAAQTLAFDFGFANKATQRLETLHFSQLDLATGDGTYAIHDCAINAAKFLTFKLHQSEGAHVSRQGIVTRGESLEQVSGLGELALGPEDVC